MVLKAGTIEPKDFRIGALRPNKLMQGSQLVWPPVSKGFDVFDKWRETNGLYFLDDSQVGGNAARIEIGMTATGGMRCVWDSSIYDDATFFIYLGVPAIPTSPETGYLHPEPAVPSSIASSFLMVAQTQRTLPRMKWDARLFWKSWDQPLNAYSQDHGFWFQENGVDIIPAQDVIIPGPGCWVLSVYIYNRLQNPGMGFTWESATREALQDYGTPQYLFSDDMIPLAGPPNGGYKTYASEFIPQYDGIIPAIKRYATQADRTQPANIWDTETRQVLAHSEIAGSWEPGWRHFVLNDPVRVQAGRSYTIGVSDYSTGSYTYFPLPAPVNPHISFVTAREATGWSVFPETIISDKAFPADVLFLPKV